MITTALSVLLFFSRAQQTPPPQEKVSMASIPAGDFWMGRVHYFLIDEVGWLERDRRDDLPAHKVYIDAFSMDKYEVTNEAFARFLDATGGRKLWYWPGGKIAKGEERFPVHDVTWYQADAYCKSVGKRLPTEAEWERAARGGLDRKKFSWGDGGLGLSGSDTDTQVSAEATNTKRAHVGFPFGPTTVGSYPPNGFGLYDMTGNVWEWINDWYDRDYYTVTPDRNPPGPATGMYKVIRGGGWSDDDDRNLMNHYRNFADPSKGASTIGFRCAK
jgi:formylglycine-generating enzyme required for sulfatase activity